MVSGQGSSKVTGRLNHALANAVMLASKSDVQCGDPEYFNSLVAHYEAASYALRDMLKSPNMADGLTPEKVLAWMDELEM